MSKERLYRQAAVIALIFGILACVMVCCEQWRAAMVAYFSATMFRLLAGAFMNRMGDADAVNAWNNKYHRFVVIVLNAVVGAVLLGRLAWDARLPNSQDIGPLVFLVSAFALYFIAARFTKPNTFAARVRSATLTVVLIGVMAHLAFEVHWFVLAFAGAMVFGGTFGRLRQLQRRFGWADW